VQLLEELPMEVRVAPGSVCPQVNGVSLHCAEHHVAVEALRGSGSSVSMTVLRERMVEPENAITVTPLRPEDDYSPRERRGGLRFPERPEGVPPTERYSTCLVRNEKGLGFSIAGGKGSTPYRAGDTVSNGFLGRKVLRPRVSALLVGAAQGLPHLWARSSAAWPWAGGPESTLTSGKERSSEVGGAGAHNPCQRHLILLLSS